MTKKRLKWKYKNIIIALFFFLCIFGMIYSLIHIIKWKIDVDDNSKIQDKIEGSITIIEPAEEKQKAKYNIDFKKLKETNADTVAYIKVNHTNINYIVVRGSDNSYYLKHNFERNWNVAGWIFGDYRNKFDESDKNIIIYGHNTKDGSMFGSLKNILNEDWYSKDENRNVILVTEKGQYQYRVFSVYSIKAEDYYINTEFKNNDEFGEFVNTLKSRSIYDFGEEVEEEDKILTLSSCIGDGSKRVVLHAKLVEINENNEMNVIE